MTSYITINNSEIDPDSPITADLMTKFRDNPIALAEGATGAPRIYGPAMYSPVAGSVTQRNCLPFGNEQAFSNTAGNDLQNISASGFTALVSCTVRVNLSVSMTFQSSTAGALVIRKNGTGVQVYTSAQTNVNFDVTLAVGDCLGVYLTATGTSGGNSATVTATILKYNFDARSAVMS